MSDDIIAVKVVVDSSGAKSGIAETKGEIQGLNPVVQQMGQTFADASKATTTALANMNVALGNTTRAVEAETKATGNAYAAKELLRHSVRSATDSFAAGMPVMMIVTEQFGRLAEAAEYSGGALGKVGSFMSGPWGIAISIGISVLGNLVGKLFDAADASDAMRDHQKVLADTIDKTTGAINRQITAAQLLATQNDTASDEAALRGEYLDKREKLVKVLMGGKPGIFSDPFSMTPEAETKVREIGRAFAAQTMNAGQVSAAIQDLSQKYKELGPLAAHVAEQVGGRSGKEGDGKAGIAELAQQIEKKKSELAVLQGRATPGDNARLGIGDDRAAIEAKTDLAAATNRVERAEANLKIVKLDENAAIKSGGQVLVDYTAKLTAAKQEVESAKQAVKDASKERVDAHKAEALARKEAAEATRKAFEQEKIDLENLKGQDDARVAKAREFTAQMAATYTEDSDQYRRAKAEEIRIEQEAAAHKLAIEQQLNENRKQLALDHADQVRANAQFEFDMGTITKRRLLQADRDYENQRYQIELLAMQNRARLMAQDPTHNVAALVQLQGQIQAAERAHQNALTNIDRQGVLQRVQLYRQAFQPITDQFARLITLQQGFSSTFKGIWQSMVGTVQTAVSRMLEYWLVGLVTKDAMSKEFHLKQVMMEAKQAAAGAYNSLVHIPIVGPILAPIGAAAAFTAVMAFSSAERGAGEVGYDNAPFLLHKQEMVLPANLAIPLRSMLLGSAANNNTPAAGNGGGFGSTTHNHYYTINSVDGQDAHRFIMKHHSSVAQAAEKAHRNGFKPK